jgi:hypothetical protein
MFRAIYWSIFREFISTFVTEVSRVCARGRCLTSVMNVLMNSLKMDQ